MKNALKQFVREESGQDLVEYTLLLAFVALASAALFIGASAIGLAPIFVRLSLLGPVATGFWRVFLAMPVFLLLMDRKQLGTEATHFDAKWKALAVTLPGIFFGFDMALWNTSVNTTSVANATLLTNISPIFVAIVSWFMFGERFTRTFIVGMIGADRGARARHHAAIGRPVAGRRDVERVRAGLHDRADARARRGRGVPHAGGTRRAPRSSAGEDEGRRGQPRFREGGVPPRRHQTAAQRRPRPAVARPEILIACSRSSRTG